MSFDHLQVYEYNPLYNYRLQSEHGLINDMITTGDSQLNFDLEHPVDIEIQPSYDGSVNLILNDGKNIPRLINSRFSVREKGTYEIKAYFSDGKAITTLTVKERF